MKYITTIFFAGILAGTLIFWNDNVTRAPVHISARGIEGVRENPFGSISLAARAAYVLDVRTGSILYEKNAELQFPLASLAKVMSALVAYDIAPDATVTITPRALAAEGDSGLLREERWQLSDLIDFTLMTSSNDGARALASVGASFTDKHISPEPTFISRMNEKARAIGMAQTFFLNETGLDEDGEISGAYGSAKDVAALFAYIIRTEPNIFNATIQQQARISSFDAPHTATNTNIIAEQIPGLIASKTGYTDLAGGNLAIAFEAGPLRPIIIVVLGSTEEGRFQDVEALVGASIRAIQ